MSKTIFVACPIGAEGSPERIRSDKVLRHIITPVVNELLDEKSDEVIIRSDKMGEPGRITAQILRELQSSDVVIADLTGSNPNVMYELGIRQALVKPYILMAEEGQRLPFDLSDFRTIFYKLELDGVDKAQIELTSQLRKALEGQTSQVDATLFGQSAPQEMSSDSQSGQGLLTVLEACNQILRETQETKELLLQVGGITLSLQEAEQKKLDAQQEAEKQQMGMWLFQQLIENPESVEKVMPAMEAFAKLGQNPTPSDAPPLQAEIPKIEPLSTASQPNRAQRRRQPKQKGD